MQWMTLLTLSAPPMPAMMSRAVASKPVRPSSAFALALAPAPPAACAAGLAGSAAVRAATCAPASTGPAVSSRETPLAAELVTATIAVVSLPASRICSRSIVPSDSPARTRCPVATVSAKGRPLSSTVSTPRWRRTSRPSSVVMPTA